MEISQGSGESRKPKREQSVDETSPSSKRHGGGELTLATLQRLLEAQTKELRQACSDDIQRAVQTLEAATIKRIDGVRNDVQEIKHHLSQHEGKLDDVRRTQEALQQRVEELEKRGCATASTTLGELDRKFSLVLGGWPSDARKDDIERYVDETLAQLELKEYVDNYL